MIRRRLSLAGALLGGLLWALLPGFGPARAAAAPQSSDSSRKDLPALQSRLERLPALKCKLQKFKPQLDYELRFSAAYSVSVAINRLRGAGGRLTTTTVVYSLSVEDAEPLRLRDVYRIQSIPQTARGSVDMGGYLAMGEGEYRVEWELRDQAGRSCHLSWNIKAQRSGKHRGLELTLRPGEVRSATTRLFRPDRTARASSEGQGLRVRLLINLDMRTRRNARVRIWRYVPMISGLRVMSRHADLAEFSVVAFSLKDQKVLHRQPSTSRIDFPALGRAIDSLSPGTVEFETLRKGSDINFLDELFLDELGGLEDCDAVIFVGSDDRFGKRISREVIEQVRAKDTPVFHFNSTFYLWRGAIGNTVRSLGGKEFRVREPRDLALAVDEIVARILEWRSPRP